MSYFYNDTTDATRIQDRAGNKAVAIDGYRSVVNVTRGGPGVARTTFANTGPYALGDTVEIDVVFSESVTVTGRPKLALEVGASVLEALWKTGQSAGATQRFEYTVVEGDLDTDGLRVMVNGLATPPSSTIETSDDATDVLLGHTAANGGSGRRVDGVHATIASAEVVAKTLTMTWDEALDEDTVPATTAFTVDAGTSGNRAVTNVEVSGSEVTLTLARGIAADTENVTVDYEPPATNALRDTAGTDATEAMDQAVIAVQGVNNPATGRVTFFGTGTVGQTVNATVSGLVDEDGLEAVTYTYQWVRVEEGTESDIADATGAGYTMTAADAGKRLKLKASFTDFLNNAEMLTSAPWPAAEPVAWTQTPRARCPPSL